MIHIYNSVVIMAYFGLMGKYLIILTAKTRNEKYKYYSTLLKSILLFIQNNKPWATGRAKGVLIKKLKIEIEILLTKKL